MAQRCIPSDRNALLTTPPSLLVAAVLAAVTAFTWAYWPTLAGLVRTWETVPDYGHGFLVPPIAVYFLWARRGMFPGLSGCHAVWPGIALLFLAAVMRYVAALYFLQPVDGWSILLWAAGLAWIGGGWKWFRWCFPSIAFLIFMIPLPFRVERLLSYPLQHVAALVSSWTLRCFGLPAFAQGNTILIADQALEVEQACSGLRIFVGIAALAFVYIVLARRSWWEKGLLVFAILPIALAANSARIVLTGLLYQVSDATAQKFSHDVAGWLMLPFAALLFALTLQYLSWLFPLRQQFDVRSMTRLEPAGGPARQLPADRT